MSSVDGLVFVEVFERLPLSVIFCKKAPPDLSNIDYDKDFTYFYFSPAFESRCQLKRIDMCDDMTNAKTHFPTDYRTYFDVDCNVITNFTNGRVLSICEPWDPSGICTYVYTRKTTLHCHQSIDKDDEKGDESIYMLGCFDLVDDVVLGISSFKRIPYSSSSILPLKGSINIPLSWFIDAFKALPNAMVIVSEYILETNNKWDEIIPNMMTNTVMIDSDGRSNLQTMAMKNIDYVSAINKLFNSKGFLTNYESLQESSAWLTSIVFPIDMKNTNTHIDTSMNNNTYDIGTYGVKSNGQSYQVTMIRPTLKCTFTNTSKWVAELVDTNTS